MCGKDGGRGMPEEEDDMLHLLLVQPRGGFDLTSAQLVRILSVTDCCQMRFMMFETEKGLASICAERGCWPILPLSS